jgi:hypothetical protein
MMESPGVDMARSGHAPMVRERQIDFLLEEEFSSNPDFLTSFLRWLAGQTSRSTMHMFSVRLLTHSAKPTW